MEIEIHQPDKDLQLSETQLHNLIQKIFNELKLSAASCSIIFMNDDDLAQMHADYFDDPDKTDVITFDLGETPLEGEIYISHERAKAQSIEYNVSYTTEVVRLIIHGILHLAGFDDLNTEDRRVMKDKENQLVEKYTVLNV